MAIMGRGTFYKAIIPGYKNVVFMSLKEHPPMGEKLVNVKTETSRAYIEDFQVAGLGPMFIKGEGTQVTFDEGKAGTSVRYVFTTWALAFRITEEMYDDDLYNIFGNKFSKSLGRSARDNRERVMHAPYNNAFNTAYSGFYSGVSLVSTAQQYIKGGTWSNRSATDADFGLLALQAGVENFQNQLNEEGQPARLTPKWVLHSVTDQWIVGQVLKTEKLPGGNMNDKNTISTYGINSAHPMGDPYLTDPDAWFLIADEHDVNFYDRRKFRFKGMDDFKTGDAMFKGDQRNGSGFGSPIGIYGSSGT